jgi:hypothetical protein
MITPRLTLISDIDTDNPNQPDRPPLAPSGSGPHDPGMEARVAKVEATVENIQTGVQDIKGILARLVPVLDRMDGFVQGKMPHLATKEDMEKRPTWARITATVAFIALLASLPFWSQWVALFKTVFRLQ